MITITNFRTNRGRRVKERQVGIESYGKSYADIGDRKPAVSICLKDPATGETCDIEIDQETWRKLVADVGAII